MNKLEKIFLSTRTMAVLLLIYALAMGVATFVENDFDTNTAKILVYNARWFEVLMLWLIVLFIVNIKHYRLWKREKWPLLVFHLAFVLIFIGGAITRYISFEGQMLIPEGETTNEIVSDKTYFKLQVDNGQYLLAYDNHDYMVSHLDKKEVSWPFKQSFKGKYKFENNNITLRSLDFIPRAKDSVVLNPKGPRILELTSIGQEGREKNYIQEGEIKSIGGILIGFNREMEGVVQIVEREGQLFIKSPFEGEYIAMAGQQVGKVTDAELLEETAGKLAFNTFEPFGLKQLYSINAAQFVAVRPAFNADIKYFSGDKSNPNEKDLADGIQVELDVDGAKDTLVLIGRRGLTNFSAETSLNGLNISLGFGSKIVTTPFSIRLDDFILTRYPGSMNPSSFESEITVIDKGKEMPKHIYMNNVMDYRGYRFFQASYFPDERGTVLSVNQDWWGTNITYIGYFFLFGGLFISLFWKGTHFWKLNATLKKLHNKQLMLLSFLLMSGIASAQHTVPHASSKMSDPDSLLTKINIPKEHAEKFGSLLVQDIEGRIKPMNTHSLEILRKIHKKSDFHGLSSDQWLLSVQLNPELWANAPLIKVNSKGGDQLLQLTNADEKGYTSLMHLVDVNTTRYKLDKQYNEAFSKRAADRSKFDDEIINITERFSILDNTANGYQIKIIPVENDLNERWTSWIYSSQENPIEIDSKALKIIGTYFNAVKKAQATAGLDIPADQKTDSIKKYWAIADQQIDSIKAYQHQWGKNVMPSANKVNLEIFYNKADAFLWIMIAYSIFGLLLVVLAFITLFKEGKLINIVTNSILFLSIIAFLLHAVALGIRWYLSGHAPWSDGYEAIIFISWIAVLSGLLLYRNRNAFIPATGVLVAAIMMGFAHGGSLLDPQITPLVPVLKSYWLLIHVAIITSSYGFFGLGGMISIISLILILLKPTPKIKHSLSELSIVSEMALTVGLFLLTVGTFLGGMWANESWGRYWSWDPKETWSFISVIIYAFVLHMRLVPGLRGKWAYNAVSMWALWSIIMTYFGVNYYLSGLHSYAAGDAIPIPIWVYIGIAFMVVLTVVSYFTNKRFNKK